MDDIKIFGSSVSALDNRVSSIRKLAKVVGLEINNGKSGLVTDASEGRITFTDSLRNFPLISEKSKNPYKYLGFKLVWVNYITTKEEIDREAIRRIRKIAGSRLTLVNIGEEIRISIASLIRYISQAMEWKVSELFRLNRLTRCLFKRRGLIPYRITNARLYVDPAKGGLGLPNFIEEDYMAICSKLRYIAESAVEEDMIPYEERTASTMIVTEQRTIQHVLRNATDPVYMISANLERRRTAISFTGQQNWSHKTSSEERPSHQKQLPGEQHGKVECHKS